MPPGNAKQGYKGKTSGKKTTLGLSTPKSGEKTVEDGMQWDAVGQFQMTRQSILFCLPNSSMSYFDASALTFFPFPFPVYFLFVTFALFVQ